MDGCIEANLAEYEMVIVGLQNEHIVMDNDKHISTYRAELCRSSESYLEIRKRY